MDGYSGTKINQLLKIWPTGTVASTSWLESQGVYHQLAADYERHSWLKRIGHGAFIKAGDEVDWQGALYALQKHLQLPIHAGGKTALGLHGRTHFLSLGKGSLVYLFGPTQLKLPLWFKKQNWKGTIHHVRTTLFSDDKNFGLTQSNFGTFEIQVSTRERAILELLYLIPNQQSYEEAKQLFEGLRTLRSELLQELLKRCKSIKVKRLFFHFADLTSQPWLSELNLSQINLGKGKRVIGQGGIFDSKYQISVPRIKSGSSSEELEGP